MSEMETVTLSIGAFRAFISAAYFSGAVEAGGTYDQRHIREGVIKMVDDAERAARDTKGAIRAALTDGGE